MEQLNSAIATLTRALPKRKQRSRPVGHKNQNVVFNAFGKVTVPPSNPFSTCCAAMSVSAVQNNITIDTKSLSVVKDKAFADLSNQDVILQVLLLQMMLPLD
ncbi:hypothetical protein KP509_04G027500 [Ceratopteris richardii]|uniref:Uncharacterized protein n=1 Tax=Ceratopteris richardii TaxID=49495 RepID=A0A8T2UTR3_CERRI|nr:hypothetical protein KP509_04G027500 [Ceratopteris richardii]